MLKIRDDIDDLTPSEMSGIIRRLPLWRQDVVMRYKSERCRRQSALAFALLQEMLAERYGITDDIEVCIGEHGKPSLARHPDIHFNISHCPQAVACAVDSHPVGVDVESLGRYNEALARHTLSEAEFAGLFSTAYPEYPSLSPAEAADLAFTILWTKKEALLKLLGTGITDNLPGILHQHSGAVTFRTAVNLSRRYVCTTCHHSQ